MDSAVLTAPLLRIAMGAGALPNDFTTKPAISKDGIHFHLQVVTRSWITMQVDGACILQDAPHLQQAHTHHDEIAHHALAVSQAGRINDAVQGRLLFRKFAVPCRFFV